MTTENKAEGGIFGILCLAVGGGCLVVAAISAINVMGHLDLALSVYGTETALPNSWEGVAGLAAAGVLIVGLTMFGGLVRRKFAAAKGRPLVRAAILAAAFGLLALVFRGLQVLALTHTYGSMLAYYATDGDLGDVKAELAKGPDTAALDAAVSRAAQYDNEAALALLLAAGADMRDSSRPAERRRCALVGKSAGFIKTALDHGVRPDACPGGETAIWEAVRFGQDDAEVARTVTLLRGAGWSPTAVPGHDKQSPAEHAAAKKWTQTQAALAAP
jgi:hypothetical protein